MGKSVSDLQSGVEVHDTWIDGTLHYVDDFTGFSSNVAQQSGNYLVLSFAHSDGATTTVEIIGGTSGPVALDSDMVHIARIANTDQKIKVVTTLDDETVTKIYSLNSLTLETA